MVQFVPYSDDAVSMVASLQHQPGMTSVPRVVDAQVDVEKSSTEDCVFTPQQSNWKYTKKNMI